MKKNNNALPHMAVVDGLFYGVGIASTVLELALVSVNPNFGHYGLEVMSSLIIFGSICLSSISGVFFVKRYACFKTTILGCVLKTLAVIILALAVITSFYNAYMCWSTLAVFIIIDTIASGCLISSYAQRTVYGFYAQLGII